MLLPVEKRFIIQLFLKRIKIRFDPRPDVFFHLMMITDYVHSNAISSQKLGYPEIISLVSMPDIAVRVPRPQIRRIRVSRSEMRPEVAPKFTKLA